MCLKWSSSTFLAVFGLLGVSSERHKPPRGAAGTNLMAVSYMFSKTRSLRPPTLFRATITLAATNFPPIHPVFVRHGQT